MTGTITHLQWGEAWERFSARTASTTWRFPRGPATGDRKDVPTRRFSKRYAVQSLADAEAFHSLVSSIDMTEGDSLKSRW